MIFLDKDLEKIADDYKESYAAADYFPHVVIDHLFSNLYPVAQACKAYCGNYYQYNNVFEIKKAFDRFEELPPTVKRLIFELNSTRFLVFLEKLTGIQGLIPDPFLRGGGIHRIEQGGKLDVHVDFNWHPKLNLIRRLNAIIYLNIDWLDEWNGHLELWNQNLTKCKRIRPDFNRMVIFQTDDMAYHGHPEPLRCPENRSRLSIALYYYTAPTLEDYEKRKRHSTLYQKLPHQNTNEEIEKLRQARSLARITN